MSLVVNHNLMAANVARNLNTHYGKLAQSTQRLSTGLRVNSAADDAAGLAIRELQRADIAALHQGARNANDAVSMIQTADGALAIIDEKLIRMKELAEQAATGTYDSTQRLMIDSEFQAMASEIDRIANATDFNGIHLLNGNLSGAHDGSGLNSTGSMKIHFGSGNESCEDYYYVDINDCSTYGLGLRDNPTITTTKTTSTTYGDTKIISDVLSNGVQSSNEHSGIKSFAIIPKGSQNIKLHMFSGGWDDDIQIFKRNGEHIVGTKPNSTPAWLRLESENDSSKDINYINSRILTEENGFYNNAVYSNSNLNSRGDNVGYWHWSPFNRFSIDEMNIQYSGSGVLQAGEDGSNSSRQHEWLNIDETSEDLVLIVLGGPPSNSTFNITASWDKIGSTESEVEISETIESKESSRICSISTQELAQKTLNRINDAIVIKDKIRAHLGALQNRLENTITNITTQAENLQAAESRISDVDVATEMTEFVRQQILAQSAVAMLSQANSMPQMAMQLIGG